MSGGEDGVADERDAARAAGGDGVVAVRRDDAGEETVASRAAVTRREALAYLGGTGVGLGGWRALDNVVLGYGVLTGTNLVAQDLAPLVAEDLGVRSGELGVAGRSVRTDGTAVSVHDGGDELASVAVATDAVADARAIDRELGLAGAPVERLFEDLRAVAADEFRFSLSTTGPFFERVREGDARPEVVEMLRGPTFSTPDPTFVGEFTGVDPADTAALVQGLAAGFREHSYYDVPRYLAGSVEDNVLLGAIDLRQYFESPTDFEALAAGENSGLFCTELAGRAIEAFHAVPATEQAVPVVAGFVSDQRHKHAYTVLASAVREDDQLVLPVTFVDYTHATLYDDLRLTSVLGEGLEAYGSRHRATYVRWNRYPTI